MDEWWCARYGASITGVTTQGGCVTMHRSWLRSTLWSSPQADTDRPPPSQMSYTSHDIYESSFVPCPLMGFYLEIRINGNLARIFHTSVFRSTRISPGVEHWTHAHTVSLPIHSWWLGFLPENALGFVPFRMCPPDDLCNSLPEFCCDTKKKYFYSLLTVKMIWIQLYVLLRNHTVHICDNNSSFIYSESKFWISLFALLISKNSYTEN